MGCLHLKATTQKPAARAGLRSFPAITCTHVCFSLQQRVGGLASASLEDPHLWARATGTVL